jgi:hypothetical protein
MENAIDEAPIAPAHEDPTGTSLVLQREAPMAAILQKAEIDQQIATAKQYPRSIKLAVSKIKTLALLDEQTAEECMYALPRGGKPITGPSARFAEIVSQCWGNGRVDARVTHVDREEGYIEAEGVYLDLEENVATRRRVRRRITNKQGRVFNDDMIIVTGNAACSIAARNAVLAGVPKAVWRGAYEEARGVTAGDVQTLAETRDKSIKAFAQFGVKPEQIYGALGVKGEVEITVDHIPVLRGMYSTLKNGEETVETMFTARNAGNHEKVENPLADKKPETPKADVSGGETDTPAPSEKPEPEKAPATPAKKEIPFPGDQKAKS